MCLYGSYSTLLPTLSDVLQGSILIGTFPVLVHINDLFLSIHHSSALSFTDDTKLFKLIFELADSLKLQEDLTSILLVLVLIDQLNVQLSNPRVL